MNNPDITSELHAIILSLIGGGRYGVKIRLPHAAVMTLLFRHNISIQDKIKIMLSNTYEHSRNLASFAALYKTLLFILKYTSYRLRHATSPTFRKNLFCRVGRALVLFMVDGSNSGGERLVPRPPGFPSHTRHAAISGAIGGYLIWGKYSSINYQIILYLMSRIVMGAVSLARKKGLAPFRWEGFRFANVYPIQAAVVWGAVMAMFEDCPEVLHTSLKRSMDEVYRFGT